MYLSSFFFFFFFHQISAEQISKTHDDKNAGTVIPLKASQRDVPNSTGWGEGRREILEMRLRFTITMPPTEKFWLGDRLYVS